MSEHIQESLTKVAVIIPDTRAEVIVKAEVVRHSLDDIRAIVRAEVRAALLDILEEEQARDELRQSKFARRKK